MKGATTIQERLWELRKDKGLNLEELSQKTDIQKGFVKIARYQKQSGQLPTQEKMKTAVVRMDFPTTAVNLGDNIHFLFFCYWSCEVHPLRNASCNSILPRKNKVNY